MSKEVKRAFSRMSSPGEIEQGLVKRAREGDSRAFEDLVRMYQGAIFGFLLRLSGNREDAVELTQTTFVKSWMAIGGFRGDSSFRTYLYKAATNAWRNAVRDRSRRPTVDVEDVSLESGQNPHAEAERAQERGRLWRLIQGLPGRQREIVLLRVREGLSFEEAARAMGCSVGAAKASYHNAVGRLREDMRGKKP